MTKDYLTTNQGIPIPDDQNSLTVGERGPILLHDAVFLEKIAQFDRERIPERVVHAKGAGAHGYFKVYKNMTSYTKAKFLQNPLKQTPVFVRFSTDAGSRTAPDSVRAVRGVAVKFYTEDGNYDLISNNIPVFFIRDPIKLPDLIHALKGDPVSNMHSDSRLWDYMSLTPESTHMLTWLFSDLATIKSYRYMESHGVNTYKWINAMGKSVLIKYHWNPCAGIQFIDSAESTRLAGTNPDIASKDLYDTLEDGKTVEYELLVQIMELDDEDKFDFDPLDDTKTWPEDMLPLIPVGKMVLNKNPDNFFAQVEQSAFNPATIVPGISFSNDKVLQGRVFPYSDTQRYRLGTNFLEIPINRPKTPVNNNNQDGNMQIMPNHGSTNYSPNTLGCGIPKTAPESGIPEKIYVEGYEVRKPISKKNDYSQAGERYCFLNSVQQDHLVSNIVESLSQALKPIQERMLIHFMKANTEFGERIAVALKNKLLYST
ncbi:catalase [Clostridium estertheticum]|uniref:catalase n=1 Tax=Clostridium estertheticum TaxID=238834 RepID=UPI001C7E1A07|nr:catalase [Clostridium estertheticum]MBX4260314.1 catalase [Clostridium estertheticum]WLC70989.1 catalase [Clostridium estertheticum]